MSYLIQSGSGDWIDPTNQPLSNMGVTMSIVTPAMAKHWLREVNIDNRNMRLSQVRYISNLIRNSQYHQDASVVSFSCIRTLLNGQHTLKAIADTDTPLSVTIQYGMPPEAYAAYDTGVPRTLTDVTDIDPFIVAIINVLYYVCHRAEMPRRLSPAMLQSFRQMFNDAFKEIELIANWRNVLRPAMIPAAFIASYYLSIDHRYWHRIILKWLSNDIDIVQTMRMPRIVNAWNAAAKHNNTKRNGGAGQRQEYFLKAMRVFDFQSKEHAKIYSISIDTFREKLREIMGI